jgi:hypothetical protein
VGRGLGPCGQRAGGEAASVWRAGCRMVGGGQELTGARADLGRVYGVQGTGAMMAGPWLSRQDGRASALGLDGWGAAGRGGSRSTTCRAARGQAARLVHAVGRGCGAVGCAGVTGLRCAMGCALPTAARSVGGCLGVTFVGAEPHMRVGVAVSLGAWLLGSWCAASAHTRGILGAGHAQLVMASAFWGMADCGDGGGGLGSASGSRARPPSPAHRSRRASWRAAGCDRARWGTSAGLARGLGAGFGQQHLVSAGLDGVLHGVARTAPDWLARLGSQAPALMCGGLGSSSASGSVACLVGGGCGGMMGAGLGSQRCGGRAS